MSSPFGSRFPRKSMSERDAIVKTFEEIVEDNSEEWGFGSTVLGFRENPAVVRYLCTSLMMAHWRGSKLRSSHVERCQKTCLWWGSIGWEGGETVRESGPAQYDWRRH